MKFQIWVTKYALTQGILKCEAEIKDVDDYCAVAYHGSSYPTYYHRPFWHLTEEAAIEHAKRMKEKRIKNLQKQLQKLEKLQF